MIKVKSKVESYKHQFFWLELWEELLNIYTIEAHSTPLTNLYWIIDEYQQTYIPNKYKGQRLRQIEEMKKSNIGIEKDFIMEETYPIIKNLLNCNYNNKWDLIEDISNIQIDEDKYFSNILFELYQILSKQDIEIEEFSKIEFLTKVFIAGLLNRKFSWYYLQARPSIFIKNNHFVKGNFQYKLNYLFSNFFREKEKWDVYFKITLKKDILSLNNTYTGVEFVPNNHISILQIIEDFKKDILELNHSLKVLKNGEYKNENFFIKGVKEDLNKNKILNSIDLSLSTYSREALIYFFNIFRPIKLLVYDNKNFSKQLTNNKLKELSQLNIEKNWEIKILNLSNQELLDRIKKVKNKLQTKDDILAFIYLFKDGDKIESDIKKIEKQISFLEKSNNKIFAIVKDVEASDPNAVQKIAKNRLLRLLNVIRYNSPNISFNLNSIDGNVLLKESHKTLLLEKEKHLNYRKNLDFREEEITIQLKYIKNCKSKEIEYSLQNIMHFYGMYLDAQYDSQKFLSLWIGLEKLCDSQNNIGGTVSKSVSNILALYQLRKLLRNFWHDLERFGLSDSLSYRFNISVENKKVNEEKLFIAIKNNSTKILEIITEETNSQILFYRLKKLTYIFQSLNSLQEYITQYKYEVENSIRRLYAIRNKIAHEAYIDTDLALYVKQLEHFFKITYNNILYSSSKKEYSSMRKIFEEVYDKKYEDIWGNNQDIINDFFQNSNINKLRKIINPI